MPCFNTSINIATWFSPQVCMFGSKKVRLVRCLFEFPLQSKPFRSLCYCYQRFALPDDGSTDAQLFIKRGPKKTTTLLHNTNLYKQDICSFSHSIIQSSRYKIAIKMARNHLYFRTCRNHFSTPRSTNAEPNMAPLTQNQCNQPSPQGRDRNAGLCFAFCLFLDQRCKVRCMMNSLENYIQQLLQNPARPREKCLNIEEGLIYVNSLLSTKLLAGVAMGRESSTRIRHAWAQKNPSSCDWRTTTEAKINAQ